MRILFVHQNFPGQFLHLAPALAQRGHEVLALTADTNRNRAPVPAVRYKWEPPTFDSATFGLARMFAEMTYRGQVVASAAAMFRDDRKFEPDIVFGIIGWGETLFLKEVWPNARHILYAEFFYGSRGRDVDFDPETSNDSLLARIATTARQGHLLLAVNGADHLLAPTRWQAQTFPDCVRDRMTVIHDGIDTAQVSPCETATVELPGTRVRLRKGDEVLTFVNRNLEPHRGFHIFMRVLPKLLQARPQAQVVIVGGDRHRYSPKPPSGKTWKQTLLDEVGARLDVSRVHFVAALPYATFVDLMRISRVHAYWTYPFVLSWSMLEAMSAGALVVASRTPPVEEVIEDGVNGRLVDFFDTDAWISVLTDALANPETFDPLRAQARRTVVERYDLRSKCLPALLDFVESAGR